MAKKSMIARDKKRIAMIDKYAEKRAELKKLGDYDGLAKLPKNSSPSRRKNRCIETGRPRAYMRNRIWYTHHSQATMRATQLLFESQSQPARTQQLCPRPKRSKLRLLQRRRTKVFQHRLLTLECPSHRTPILGFLAGESTLHSNCLRELRR